MMTKDKAQKRAVRDRMDKTGERYTSARHYLLDLHRTEQDDHETVDGTVATAPPPSAQAAPDDRAS